MAGVIKTKEKLVFGLDIGTRSIVGTVGFKEEDKFLVMAQVVVEHESRSMMDGQIHDIAKVAKSIAKVKAGLEEKIEQPLSKVCIAAAGRVLRTRNIMVEQEFPLEVEMTKEEIVTLNTQGVENAFEEFMKENDLDIKFYCVGYSVMHYYLNGYAMSNLEGHKAKKVAADMIVTFLPEDVVDGLYKAVELANLQVENLTLEPIAAIQVAIPEKFRMLNIALIDVGAGTSDVSVTRDGAIVAYGMIPMAGDSLTEVIAKHCLVDFVTAEKIKRDTQHLEKIEYNDILGLGQSITRKQVLEVVEPVLDKMTTEVAKCIKSLNADQTVSAAFVVGGGGMMIGYTEKIAKALDLPEERVAIRGEQVMEMIEFLEENATKDSLMVTPIGICLNYYEHTNNFILVNFNSHNIKLYDNNKLTVADAAMHINYPNEDLFPKRGDAINFTVNTKARMVRGYQGEAAKIQINGVVADLYASIHGGDVIKIEPSSKGVDAEVEIQNLKEYTEKIIIYFEETRLDLPKYASVNGELKSGYYKIQNNDSIEFLNYYTLAQFLQVMDMEVEVDEEFLVNNEEADMDTPIFENFVVRFGGGKRLNEKRDLVLEFTPKEETVNINPNIIIEELEDTIKNDNESKQADDKNQDEVAGNQEEISENIDALKELSIVVNNMPVVLTGKKEYIYVDVFDFIDFDLAKPEGTSVVTNLNGKATKYMQSLKEGDVIDIYWEN